jgi:hypothetical protein
MYIDIVPNRDSPPAVLLRESYREGKKVLKRTIANLSQVPRNVVEGLRILLRGGVAVEHFEDSFEIERSLPHGHVAAVLGMLQKLKVDTLIAQEPSEERDRVVAMIVARILDPRSKLATARGLDEETSTSTLAEMLEVQKTDAQALYTAMDWLMQRQPEIEKKLAKRHLEDGTLVLYDVSSTYFEGKCCPLGQLGHSRDEKKDKFILYLPEALRPCNPGCRSSLASYATERGVRWPWKCLAGIRPIPRRSDPRSRSSAIVSSSGAWCWWEIGA